MDERSRLQRTASIGTAAASVDWFATDVQLAGRQYDHGDGGGQRRQNVATDTIVVTVNDLSYYLAEGATGTFFDLDLLLANPNSTPVNITATFLKPLGQGTVVQQYTLPATSRTTIDVETIPGPRKRRSVDHRHGARGHADRGRAHHAVGRDRLRRAHRQGEPEHVDEVVFRGRVAGLLLHVSAARQSAERRESGDGEVPAREHDAGDAAVTTSRRCSASPWISAPTTELVNQSFGMEVTFYAARHRRARDVLRPEPAVDRRSRIRWRDRCRRATGSWPKARPARSSKRSCCSRTRPRRPPACPCATCRIAARRSTRRIRCLPASV